MPTEPRISDFPKIRGTLAVYRILAYATGVFLLVLVAEIILKYLVGVELQSGGGAGFLAFVPANSIDTANAVNVSLVIQITHGYFYLAYLVSDFVLVTFMRWPIVRFIVIALGGVVPLLSFFTERRVHREVKDYLAVRLARIPSDPSATASPTEASH
jgi:integral membrane protein